ncbi:hypothetical protein [Sphingosinithalassobacter portus]|uniref:hypothetical protein n=1 Tax=Stakelama portus TaxID=2676234 RepID=UPI0011AB649E|nr:hypothetical protein [Sphingosinithalassobacter portus]
MIVIGVGAASFLFSSPSETTDNDAPIEAVPAERSGPNEIDVVSVCDLAVKSTLVSESSFEPAWRWQFAVNGNTATVRRKFEATNGFGAKITATYHCEWNDTQRRITALRVLDSLGQESVLR